MPAKAQWIGVVCQQCGLQFEVKPSRAQTRKFCSQECKMKAMPRLLTRFNHPLKTQLKRVHMAMMQRCYNPNYTRFKDYGGRGIRICDEWRHDTVAFCVWALKNGYEPKLWIERKDVNGNYCPENCCFAARKEQMNNTRRNRFITWDGKTLTATQWANELGVKPVSFHGRLTRGWSLERIFTQPFGRQ